MLINAMKPKSKGLKKLTNDSSDKNTSTSKEETKIEVPLKKAVSKDSKSKKLVTKKKPQDTMTKFFNSYGESPHLQAIEDSYLKYLEQ